MVAYSNNNNKSKKLVLPHANASTKDIHMAYNITNPIKTSYSGTEDIERNSSNFARSNDAAVYRKILKQGPTHPEYAKTLRKVQDLIDLSKNKQSKLSSGEMMLIDRELRDMYSEGKDKPRLIFQ